MNGRSSSFSSSSLLLCPSLSVVLCQWQEVVEAEVGAVIRSIVIVVGGDDEI